jgi:hypothetical protein
MQEETDLVEKLTRTFEGKFSEAVPDYTAQYLHRVEADVKLEGIALTARTSSWIRSWSGELANLMKLSDDRHIQSILDKGIREGWSVQVTSEHLAEARIRDPGYRARRVATTEMLRAHSVAQQESFDQSPAVESKMWLHSGWRQYARLNHMELGFDKDRNTVKKDGTFTLYGADGGVYYPMYPRDSSLPPGESINCGCVCVPIVDENILGMSLEERDRLRKEAIGELDEEFNRKLDRQNERLSMGIRNAKEWETERVQTSLVGTYRRDGNPGVFSGQTEKMSLKHVRRIARDMDLNMKGSKFVINKDEELLGKGLQGHTSSNGKAITLYPDAFANREILVKTIGHEYTHLQQLRERGILKDTIEGIAREKEAYESEQGWWNTYVERTGYRQ